jgi:hypothetical protein
MDLAKILTFLSPFVGLLKPDILQIEGSAQQELKALIASKVSSPDLQELLQALDTALDGFAQLEISKL